MEAVASPHTGTKSPGGLSGLIRRIDRRASAGGAGVHRGWTPLRAALVGVTAIALLFAGSGFSAIR